MKVVTISKMIDLSIFNRELITRAVSLRLNYFSIFFSVRAHTRFRLYKCSLQLNSTLQCSSEMFCTRTLKYRGTSTYM